MIGVAAGAGGCVQQADELSPGCGPGRHTLCEGQDGGSALSRFAHPWSTQMAWAQAHARRCANRNPLWQSLSCFERALQLEPKGSRDLFYNFAGPHTHKRPHRTASPAPRRAAPYTMHRPQAMHRMPAVQAVHSVHCAYCVHTCRGGGLQRSTSMRTAHAHTHIHRGALAAWGLRASVWNVPEGA